jgi:hypothetical protein
MPEILVFLTVMMIMVKLALLGMIVAGFKGVVSVAMRVVVGGIHLFFVCCC